MKNRPSAARTITLEPVKLVARPRIIMKRDTIEYDAGRYIDPSDRKLTDLLEKMEGFQVDQHGRITFNGREVSAILIDGEDLTGSDYQSLVRNLGSKIIAKIQVLDAYNDNRLLKNMESSDRIAINLVIIPARKERLTANFLAGGAAERRYVVEAGVTALFKKLRLLLFTRMNNIGINLINSAVTQPDQHFSSGKSGSDQQAGIVSMPVHGTPLDAPNYTNENRDRQLTLINGWKAKPGISFRSRLSLSESRRTIASQGMNAVNITPSQKWTTYNIEDVHLREVQGLVTVAVNDDQMKKTIRAGELNIEWGQQRLGYMNFITGAASDSASQLFRRPFTKLQGDWSQTWQLTMGSVLIWKSFVILENSREHLLATTNRLSPFFSQDSAILTHDQLLGLSRSGVSSSISYLRSRGKFQIRTGIGIDGYNWTLRKRQHSEKTISGLPVLETDTISSNTNRFTGMLKASILYHLHPGWELAGSALAGYAMQSHTRSISSRLVYQVDVSLLRKLSQFKTISLENNLHRSGLPLADVFTGPIITGTSTLVYGLANRLFTKESRSATISYVGANVFRAQHLMVTATMQSADGDNNPEEIIYPGFLTSLFTPNGHSRSLNVSLNAGKLLLFAKGRFSIQMDGSRMRQRVRLNQNNLENKVWFLRAEFKYITAFKKLNFELASVRSLTINILESGSHNRNSFAKSSLILKTRWRPFPDFRFGLDYSSNKLSPETSVDLLDMNVSYRVSQSVTLYADLHNLIGHEYFSFRSLSNTSSATTSYQLIPRYIMIRLAFDF
ncbi:MAG: hypothetical protein ABWZ25_12380 [Chitinophagaceae bacterium]